MRSCKRQGGCARARWRAPGTERWEGVSATPETAQWQEAMEGGGHWRLRRGRRTEPSASEHLPGRCLKATQPRNRPSRGPHGPPGPWCAAQSSAMRRRLLGRCRSQLSAARGLCERGAESAPEDSGVEGQRSRGPRRRVVGGTHAHTRHRLQHTPPPLACAVGSGGGRLLCIDAEGQGDRGGRRKGVVRHTVRCVSAAPFQLSDGAPWRKKV
jgi:hypothetical protein